MAGRARRDSDSPGGRIADATEADIAGTGLTIHDNAADLADAERRALEYTEHEDSVSKHRSATSGTAESCTLAAERGLPKSTAAGADLVTYQQRKVERLSGGFDPCSLIRGS